MVTFDPVKRDWTFANRGLAFEDAEIIFAGPVLTAEDAREDYGERRFQTVGFLEGRMVMVVWTPRGDDTHVISMRKCNDREQARYQKRFEEG
ncbi:MAG: BrnT family toxin [Xanthobacteraceae bacterium]|nr:BrnT family toxin [Xanthobacteraceae bacterium]